MRDFKERIDKLLSDADDCELIGNLATDPPKRATFRKLALQFRQIAVELKAQLDGESPPPGSDVHFLLWEARRCRDLAATTSDEKVATELLRLAGEFELKAKS